MFIDTENNDIMNLVEQFEEIIKQKVDVDFDRVSAEKLNLDPRCGYVYINEYSIAVSEHGARSLDYYGGFEYVDSDFVRFIGGMKFYFADDVRVRDCIEFYNENCEA